MIFGQRTPLPPSDSVDEFRSRSSSTASSTSAAAAAASKGSKRRGSSSFECSECGRVFNTECLRDKHMRVHINRCKDCAEIFTTGEDLTEHISSKHGKQSVARCKNNRAVLKYRLRKSENDLQMNMDLDVQNKRNVELKAEVNLITVCGVINTPQIVTKPKSNLLFTVSALLRLEESCRYESHTSPIYLRLVSSS